jgi:hypothetical protein
MSARFQSLLIALAITVYCGWQSRGLLSDWRWSPYSRWSALDFLIWLVPLAVECSIIIRAQLKFEPATFLLWTALAFSLIGSLGELNVLRHIGFALALAGSIPWKWIRLPWLLAAATWMPAFGYALSKASISSSTTAMIRLVVVALISGWLLLSLKRKLPLQT